MARLATRLYWVNPYDSFSAGSDRVAHNGKVVSVRTTVSGNIGKAMIVRYRLAGRAEILSWKALAEGFTTFNTTALHSSFVTGHTVRFAQQNPLTYENELGLRDIDINDDDTFSDKPGYDYWNGTMRLIIVS